MNNDKKKEFSTFQFKIPRPLWKKFKIKAWDNDKTCGETLVDLVEKHVRR